MRRPTSSWINPVPLTAALLGAELGGLFKTEIIHRRGPWRSVNAVEYATLEWVDWFNTRRLLEPIGHVPPAEAEARYHSQAEMPTLAA